MSKWNFYYSKKIHKSLDLILNKGYCCHTYMKAAKEYNAISSKLLEEDRIALWLLLLHISPCYPDGNDYDYIELADYIKAMKNKQTTLDKMPYVFCQEDTLANIKRDNYLLPIYELDRNKYFSWYDKYPAALQY